MSDITIRQGEAKKVTFLIKRRGVALDLTTFNPAPTFRFAIKSLVGDEAYLIEKEDADFEKDEASSGYVSIILTPLETEPLLPGSYLCELESVFVADEDVDRSRTFTLAVERSIFHD